ncbi:MAG: hypothetical protein ACE5IO_02450 [Thermoplasmata archaeon]
MGSRGVEERGLVGVIEDASGNEDVMTSSGSSNETGSSGDTQEEETREPEDDATEEPRRSPLLWLKARLGRVHPAFLIAAVLAVVWIEWIMIPMQSYQDHPTMWIGLSIYLVITLISIVLLKYMFSIKYSTLLSVLTANNLILIIPIGTIVSLATGYTLVQLLSPEWEFTHDFVYVMVVSQLVATAILLFGMWWQTRKHVVAEGQPIQEEVSEKEPEIVDGEPSLTHGYGPETHKGLTNGIGRINGLANELGMVNGLTNGLASGNRKTSSFVPTGSLSSMRKTRKLLAPAVAFLLIILLLILPAVLVTPFHYEVSRDWSGVTSYSDVSGASNPNVDIVQYSATADADYLWTNIKIDGRMMGDSSPNTNTVHVFLDTDKDLGTGYSIGGMGADYLIKVYGYDGVIRDNGLYKFSDTRDNADWNGWIRVAKADATAEGNTLQTKVSLHQLNSDKKAIVYFGIIDSAGAQDYSDTRIDLRNEGALVVEQKSIAPDIMRKGLVDVMTLELTARGKPIIVKSIDITANQGTLLPIATPISLNEDETRTVTVQLDTTSLKDGSFVDVHMSSENIVTESGIVVLSGNGAKAYVGSPPSGILVDGAFGDWRSSSQTPISDQVGETANPNVDIVEYQANNNSANVHFYMKVDGSMMGGIQIPALSEKNSPPKKTSTQDGSNSGVNVDTGSQKDFPLPELTGDDTVHIFIDVDKNKATGYRPTHPFEFPIGADYMIGIRGSEGRIESSGYYEFVGKQRQMDWKEIGDVSSACDATRLESGISLALLNLTKPEFDAFVHITDWFGDEDYSDTVLSDGPGGPAVHIRTRKNGGFGDGDIDVIDGGSCAGAFGCHGLDATQVPISMSLSPSPPYFPGQKDIQITVTINMDNAAAGSLAGVSIRVGPSGTNSRYGIENDGWVIQSDPNGGTNNYIEKSGLVGGGATDLVWTVTAPSSEGTYYLEATVWYDNDGAGREYNISSEETVTVIPEFVHILMPILAMVVVFGLFKKGRRYKVRGNRKSC